MSLSVVNTIDKPFFFFVIFSCNPQPHFLSNPPTLSSPIVNLISRPLLCWCLYSKLCSQWISFFYTIVDLSISSSLWDFFGPLSVPVTSSCDFRSIPLWMINFHSSIIIIVRFLILYVTLYLCNLKWNSFHHHDFLSMSLLFRYLPSLS